MAIIKHGPSPEDHYFAVHNDFARNPDITLRTKGVYIFLRSHRAGWAMSTARIAEALGVSRDTISKAVTELEHHGYLQREQSTNAQGRFGESTYVVYASPMPKYPSPEKSDTVPPAKTAETSSATPLPKNPHTVPPVEIGKSPAQTVSEKTVHGEIRQHKKTNSSKNTKKEHQQENSAQSSIVRTGYPDTFETWWSIYPKHVGKRRALTDWKRATKRIDPHALNEHTRRYATFHNTQGTSKQYIPNPSTWLNRDGWDDELPTPIASATTANTTEAWLGITNQPPILETTTTKELEW